MKKFLLSGLIFSALGVNAQVTLPFHEPFNYNPGALISSPSVPVPTSATGTYTGYGSWQSAYTTPTTPTTATTVGNADVVTTPAWPPAVLATGNALRTNGASGLDPFLTFPEVSTGTIYMSFGLEVVTVTGTTTGNTYANTTNGSIICFAKKNTATPVNADNFGGSVAVKKIDATTYNLGIDAKFIPSSTSTTTPPIVPSIGVFDSTVFTAGASGTASQVFVVSSYNPVTGESKLWVNPALTATEPAANVTDVLNTTLATPDVASAIDAVKINKVRTADTPNVIIDELRVGTSWASVIPGVTLGLANNSLDKNAVKVAKKDGAFTVNATGINMKEAMLFDIQGRLVSKATASNNSASLTAGASRGVNFIKVTADNNKTITVKVVN
jgi:hypothetical protein